MKRLFIISQLIFINFFVLFLSTIFSPGYSALNNNEVIGKVNNENIYLNQLSRIFNTQKKKYYEDLNFNIFTPNASNLKAQSRRKEDLKKANRDGFLISNEEFKNAWDKVLELYGSIENLDKKAKENKLQIADIKLKLEENMLLNKYFERNAKENLVNLLIDKVILLQEAKSRNIIPKEEELTSKFNKIIEKYGGEEAFKLFLMSHNATVDDAVNEIKNKILIDLVKQQIISDSNSDKNTALKAFINSKRAESNIIVYSDKITDEKNKVKDLKSSIAQKNTEQKLDADKEIQGKQISDSNENVEEVNLPVTRLEIKDLQNNISLRSNKYPGLEEDIKLHKGLFELSFNNPFAKDPEKEVPLFNEVQLKALNARSVESDLYNSEPEEKREEEPIIKQKFSFIEKLKRFKFLNRKNNVDSVVSNETLIPGKPITNTNDFTQGKILRPSSTTTLSTFSNTNTSSDLRNTRKSNFSLTDLRSHLKN